MLTLLYLRVCHMNQQHAHCFTLLQQFRHQAYSTDILTGLYPRKGSMLRQVWGRGRGNLTFYILDHSLIPSHTLTATKFLYEDCYLNKVQCKFPLNTKKIPFSKIKRKLYDALAHLLTFIKKNLSFKLKLNKDF